MCVVHFQGLAGDLYTYFSDCKGHENRMEKFQNLCRWRREEPAVLPYRMDDACSQVPEDWNQNMVVIGTVTGLHKNITRLKSSIEDSETIQQTRAFSHSVLENDFQIGLYFL